MTPKQQKTIIMGLDPGIADTGYGIISVRKNTLTSLGYGSIKTCPELKLPERLLVLYNKLNTIIKKYHPALVSIEELFFCKNVKTALIVGQARGVMLLTAKKNKLPIQEFTPLQIKQAVSAYGRADKQQVQKMVQIILSLKNIPRPDDAADALAAAICAANSKI